MIINEKDTLRKAFRLIRNIYSEDFISEISSAACENIAKLEEFKDASTLLLYFPINNEQFYLHPSLCYNADSAVCMHLTRSYIVHQILHDVYKYI